MKRSWEDRIRAGGYRPPTIDGYQLTFHSLGRMLERQIHVRSVRSALTNPTLKRMTTKGSTQYSGKDATVMVDDRTKTILTVCHPATAGRI
ncbi:hypothetical protein M1M07_23725 [Rhodococcus sp. HM1]|uniref:hypothetical protein n=1 Tax=Rhodococcus sp. HM1 TaxID=2937759 RepID=UPI00200B5702|nr:hypothetical protein [Rhodococcus sp. HM1]MCK8674107.1 hypothetical protein [Rhodococcus sp. HM1]